MFEGLDDPTPPRAGPHLVEAVVAESARRRRRNARRMRLGGAMAAVTVALLGTVVAASRAGDDDSRLNVAASGGFVTTSTTTAFSLPTSTPPEVVPELPTVPPLEEFVAVVPEREQPASSSRCNRTAAPDPAPPEGIEVTLELDKPTYQLGGDCRALR